MDFRGGGGWHMKPETAGVCDPSSNIADLQQHIVDACANVSPAVLQHVQRELQIKVQMGIVIDGEKFEYRK